MSREYYSDGLLAILLGTMGYLRVSSYPIEVLLEHNDTVIEWKDDGYPELSPVYIIIGISWTEKANFSWSVLIRRESLPMFNQTITPLETDEWNIPTPQRFRSDNKSINISLYNT